MSSTQQDMQQRQQQSEQQAQQLYSRIEQASQSLSRVAPSSGSFGSSSFGSQPHDQIQTIEDLVTIREQSRRIADHADSVLRRTGVQSAQQQSSPSIGPSVSPMALTEIAEAVQKTLYLQHELVRWVQTAFDQQYQQQSSSKS